MSRYQSVRFVAAVNGMNLWVREIVNGEVIDHHQDSLKVGDDERFLRRIQCPV